MHRRITLLAALAAFRSEAAGEAPAVAAFTVTNHTASDVGSLYVSEPGDEAWSDHLVPVTLDADGTVLSGDSVEVVGLAGTWDLLVLGTDGEERMRIMDVVFADGVEVVLND